MEIRKISPNKLEPFKLQRVAAYARVSSGKDAAIHSVSAQVSYYNEYISNHPGWQFAGVYADSGISGTRADRPQFKRMIADAKAGKIDMIITKSITRFARNTVVLLETIRELKSLGIDVFFEKENMHSMSLEGELMLTLLATYAEEEARSASDNQNWRIQKMHKQGKTTSGTILGYKLVDGRFVIKPDEAETVRKIFELYLSGMGFVAIANRLNKEGITTRAGHAWSENEVQIVLTNEKYMGDMMLQKTYRKDFRDKRKYINNGEKTRYYVENSHEAIISKEDFKAVQEEMERRRNKIRVNPNPMRNSPFRSLIVCLHCGQHFHRRKNHSGTKYEKVFWSCLTANRQGKAACPSRRIPEDILTQKTLEVIGVESLDGINLRDYIDQIGIKDRTLYYRMKNGGIKITKWEYPPKSLSWTPEMREQARQRRLKRGQDNVDM